MTEPDPAIVTWLLQGDVAIRYQTHRDLLATDRPDLRARIATEGWGKRYLDCRNPDGSWGTEFYFPKWTSTHYTVLDLRNLAIDPATPALRDSVTGVLAHYMAGDGGIGCSRHARTSDVCVNGMFLNYACYFGAPPAGLDPIVDFLLREHMPDGGFNCQSNRGGARHSSMHSTLSVLEGIHQYQRNGYTYRLHDLRDAARASCGFLLKHRLFRSDRTGKVISDQFLRFRNPPRWYYNILRALDHLREAGIPLDERMRDALDVVVAKQGRDGKWRRIAGPSGKVHFDLEPPGPGRVNTLTALRVLRHYRPTG